MTRPFVGELPAAIAGDNRVLMWTGSKAEWVPVPLEEPVDLLTNIAKEADGRYEPMPGAKVRVGQWTRLVMERHENRLAKAIYSQRSPELDIEIIYLEQFQDEGFNPTHHSCSLLQWRSWARGLGVEVE